MDLVFIRHAQPEWVHEGLSILDPPLTELGRAQAERLTVRDFRRVDELWVSPTRRTRETAAPLAEHLGLTPVVQPWLEEIRLPPAWEGSPATAVAQVLKTARARTADEWWAGLEGGEAFPAFLTRVTEGLDEALRLHGVREAAPVEHTRVFQIEEPNRRVLIVAHGGTNAVAIGHLLGLPPVPWAWERFVLAHASVTRVRSKDLIGGRIFGLLEHSDVRHLGPIQVTR